MRAKIERREKNLAISSLNVMSFEESTNHLNRHPNITFAFDRHYRLSRGKNVLRRREKQDERESTRERKSRKKKCWWREWWQHRSMKNRHTVRSSTYDENCQRKSFHFRDEGQVHNVHVLLAQIDIIESVSFDYFSFSTSSCSTTTTMK